MEGGGVLGVTIAAFSCAIIGQFLDTSPKDSCHLDSFPLRTTSR